MTKPSKEEIRRLYRLSEAEVRRKSMSDGLWICGLGLFLHFVDRFASAWL